MVDGEGGRPLGGRKFLECFQELGDQRLGPIGDITVLYCPVIIGVGGDIRPLWANPFTPLRVPKLFDLHAGTVMFIP